MPPPADPAYEIEHLAQLHESGALTDEEFAAAKAKTLGTDVLVGSAITFSKSRSQPPYQVLVGLGESAGVDGLVGDQPPAAPCHGVREHGRGACVEDGEDRGWMAKIAAPASRVAPIASISGRGTPPGCSVSVRLLMASRLAGSRRRSSRDANVASAPPALRSTAATYPSRGRA